MTRFFAPVALATAAFALALSGSQGSRAAVPLLNATKHGTYVCVRHGNRSRMSRNFRMADQPLTKANPLT